MEPDAQARSAGHLTKSREGGGREVVSSSDCSALGIHSRKSRALPVRCPTMLPTITDPIASQHRNQSIHPSIPPQMTDGASGLQDDDTYFPLLLIGPFLEACICHYYPQENGD